MFGALLAAILVLPVLQAGAQPTFTKAFSPATIQPGHTSTLTFTITEGAGAAVTGLSFTDTFPAGLVIATPGNLQTTCDLVRGPGTLTGADGGTTVTLSNAQVSANSSCTVTVTVTAASNGSYANTSGNLTSSAGNGGTASATLTVSTPVPNLTKAFSPTSIAVGGRSTITFTIDNSANGSDLNVFGQGGFSDSFPTGMTVANPAGVGGTCPANQFSNPAPGATSFSYRNLTNIAAGATCTVTIDVTASIAGSLVNTTTAIGGTGGIGSATLTVTELPTTFLSKEFSGPAVPGGTVSLRFTIAPGAGAASDIAFTDNLDGALSGLVATGLPVTNICGTGSSLSGTSSLSFTGGSVAQGESCSFDVNLSVPGGAAPGTYTNTTSAPTATITVAGDGGRSGSSGSQTFPAASDELNVVGGILLTKEFTEDPVLAGNAVTMRFTMTNTDDTNAASAITFTDDLSLFGDPTPVTLPATGFCGTGSTVSTTSLGGGTNGIRISNASLAAAASCTFDVTLNVPAGFAPGSYTNATSGVSATINSASVETAGASDVLVVQSVPKFSKSFSATAQPGDTVNLEFTISNVEGTEAATGLTFTDDLNGVLAGLAATGLPLSNVCGTGSSISGTTSLTFSGGSVAAGASCTFSVPVAVPAAAATGTYTNTTSALMGSVGATGVTVTAASANLEVVGIAFSKQFTNDPTFPGGTVTLQYTIQNVSSSDATAIQFSDDLSGVIPGMASTSGTQADVCGTGSSLSGFTLVSMSGGSLTAGNSCTFSVTVSVPGNAAVGEYTSAASALSAMFGGAVTVPGAFDVLTIASPISLTKDFTDDPVAPGATAMLQFTIQNTGGSSATSLTFSDELNNVLSGLVATGLPQSDVCGSGSAISGTSVLTFTSGTVSAASSCTFSVTLQVPSGTPGGLTYDNQTSALAGTVGGSFVSADGAAASLQVSSVTPGFSKVFSPDATIAASPTQLRFSIDNTGNGVNATALGFSDTFPTGMTVATTPNASTTCPGGTLTAVAGAGSVSLSGATAPAGQSCEVVVDVVVSAAGDYANTSGDLTSSLGNSGTASDNLRANGPPVFTKAFSPTDIIEGGTSTLTLTINNTSSTVAATNMAFEDALPAGLVFTDPTNLTTTCTGGSPTAFGGDDTLTLTGGSVGASSTCTISIGVTGSTGGSYTNTSGALTSSLGASGTPSATLGISGPPPFTKAFAPNPAVQGGTSTLTLTINNSANGLAASTLSFTDTLPGGLVVAPTPNASTTCTGGTLTATAGSGSVSYSGGNVAAGATCTVSVDVTATAGNYANTTGDLTSSLGNSGTASSTVVFNPPPTFSKAFGTDPALIGASNTLTFTITNTASTAAVTALDFTDNLPAGMVVATPSNAATTCTGGTLTTTGGGGTIAYTGGSIAAGASCTVSADVVVSAAGDYTNTSGALTSSLGSSGTASDAVRVNAPPAFSKAFAPDPGVTEQAITLTFTINNSSSSLATTALAFTDNLPAGLVVATTPNAATTCTGGTLTATAGSGVISYSGGTVTAGATCTVTADVTAATPGDYSNTSGSLTSSLGNSGTASDGVRVNGPPGFSKAFATDPVLVNTSVTLTFTVDNSGSTVAAAGLSFTDTLPAGLTVATPSNAATTCTGGTLTAAAGSGSIAYSGGSVVAGATCTLSVDVLASTAGAHTNTSSSLSSSLGTSGAASDGLRVNGPPAFSKSFAPNPATSGTPVTLTFTIDNTQSSVSATSLGFTDSLPTGLVVAATPDANTTCTGGTVTAAAGSGSVTFSGGTVAAGATCTVTLDVVAASDGDYTNTTDDLTSSLGVSGVASATLRVNGAPIFTKAFLPNPATVGQDVRLTFTINNAAASVTASSLSFTDTLPTGLVVAATPNASITCAGGTVSAIAGSDVVAYSNGTVAALGTCTVGVDVVSSSAGEYTNTSGALTSSLGDSGTASATLRVNGPPTFAKGFNPPTIQMGETSRLTFTIDNSSSTAVAGSMAFSDAFPAGMAVASTPNASTTCAAGGVLATGGSSSISFSGGSVAAGASCTISVDVTVTGPGVFENTSSSLDTSLGIAAAAQATLVAGALDFGDAPDPSYPTLLTSDGARHALDASGNNIFLGSAPSAETDGQPDSAASSDTDDGVTIPSMTAGTVATVSVTVAASGTGSVGAGFLNAWIDFDRSGTWDASEQIAADVAFASAGTHGLSVSVPLTATAGTSFARFRFSTEAGLSPTGEARDGEVEDYAVEISSTADVAIGIVPPATVVAGTEAVFTVEVSNGGPANASSVSATLSLGTGLSFVTSTCGLADLSLEWGIGSLAAGAAASCDVTVLAAASGTLDASMTGVVSSISPDPNSVNNSATGSASTSATADLSVSKTGPGTALPGGTASFTIEVTNLGPSAATGVVIDDVPGAGLTLLAVSTPCTGGFPCTIGSLAVGSTVSVTVDATVSPGVVGAVTNTASVASATTDPSASNNSAIATVGPAPTADLELTKTATVVASGTSVTNEVRYVVTLTNFGPAAAAGVSALDELPPSATVTSAVVTVGSFSVSTGLWDVGTLGVGEGASLEILVETTESGEFSNTARVMTSSVPDPNSVPGNEVESENDQETVVVALLPPVGGGSGDGPVTNPLGGAVGFFAPGDPGALSKSARVDEVLLYAGSSSSGVFRLSETDAGSRVWELISPTLGEAVLETNALAVTYETGSPRLVVSLSGSGIFESLDRGITWTDISGSLDSEALRVIARAGGTWLAGTRDAGVVQLMGVDWVQRGSGLAGIDVRDIVEFGGQVYAATWGSGVLVETGGVWTSVSSGLGVPQVTSLGASHNRLLAGTWGGGVLALQGDQWSLLGTGLEAAFVQDVIAVGSAGAIAVTRSGLFELDPDTGFWELLQRGLDDQQIASAAVILDDQGQAAELYAGTSTDWVVSIESVGGDFSNGTWQPPGRDTRELVVRDLAFDASGGLFAAVQGGGVFHADDEVTAFTLLNNGLPTRDLRALLRLGLAQGGERLVAGSSRGVFLLNDDNSDGALGQGDTWTFASGSGGLEIQTLAQSGENLVAGTPDGIYLSGDEGASWQPGGLRGVDVRSLGVLASGSGLFAGTVLDGILRSAGDGLTWSTTAGGVGGPVNGVASLGTHVFGGTPQGVYVSSDLGNTWALMSFEFLANDVVSLTAVQPGAVYAGTAFGGAFYLIDQDRDGAYSDETWMRIDSIDPDLFVHALAVSDANADVYVGSTDGRIFRAEQPVGVSVEDGAVVPEGFLLGQNYPNPFNPVTTIPFALPQSGAVEVAIFDAMGREVAVLVSGVLEAGYHSVVWEAADAPSGIYLYRIRAGEFTESKRLVLMK